MVQIGFNRGHNGLSRSLNVIQKLFERSFSSNKIKTKAVSRKLHADENVYKHFARNNSTCDILGKEVVILDKAFETDQRTNVTPAILSKVPRKLHCVHNHPLNLIKRRIQNYFYKNFMNRSRNPLFSVYDNVHPVVSLAKNFDSLLVPKDHVSRNLSDSYYINSDFLLRSHTSAHQADLIRSGLDAFLVVGDVYRRDEIDASHYPVFHQCEGVRLFTIFETFGDRVDPKEFHLFEKGEENNQKQACHTQDAAIVIENDLKVTLEKLALHLFGNDVEMRWVDTYFPFTHPSWELEIFFEGNWLEVLGCGIMRQEILNAAGAKDKIGWAFGLGLERLAMRLYNIPDIRVFWSQDSGFLSQFQVDNEDTPVTYKEISKQPQCINDISFWIPEGFNENDFYDIVRSVGGDLVEQVTLFDTFFHPKKGLHSHAYHIVYRHTDRALSQSEVNTVHQCISEAAKEQLRVVLR